MRSQSLFPDRGTSQRHLTQAAGVGNGARNMPSDTANGQSTNSQVTSEQGAFHLHVFFGFAMYFVDDIRGGHDFADQ